MTFIPQEGLPDGPVGMRPEFLSDILPLDEVYPIDSMFAVRQSIRALIAVGVSAALYLTLVPTPSLFSPSSIFLFALAMKLSAVAFLASSLYWEVYRRCFHYHCNRGRLVISRGIVLRHHCSLPLLPLVEIAVKQTSLDALFGLYQVHVVTAVDPSKELGRIEGLNRANAFGLYSVLTEILHIQQSMSPAPGSSEDYDIEIE